MAIATNVSQVNTRVCTTLMDITDQSLNIILLVDFVVFSGSVSFFGVIFNIISVAVFFKMGFRETTNITLLCLSVSDTGVLLIMVAYSLLYNPLILSSNDAELTEAIFYLALAWPKGCFSRISASLTVLAAMERFVCVAWPLRVKRVITVKRITAACVAVYALLIITILPIMTGFKIGSRFNPARNTTTVGIISLSRITVLEDISLSFVTFTQFSSFLLVFVLTTGTIYKLQQNTKWRNTISSASQNSIMSSRDRKLVKMIMYVSIIFIVCTFPALSGTIVKLLVKDYDLFGKCKNLFVATFSIYFCFGTINSTINFFIYFHMSSRFRETLKAFLHIKKKNKQKRKKNRCTL